MTKQSLRTTSEKAPARADHVLSVSGKHCYAFVEDDRYHVINNKGERNGESFGYGDKGWCIVKRIRMPGRVTEIVDTKVRVKAKNPRLVSLI